MGRSDGPIRVKVMILRYDGQLLVIQHNRNHIED